MANLPDKAPDIPSANDDVPLHTDEEPPREPSPPTQNVRPPAYDRDSNIIFVEGSNNLLPTNGPRTRSVLGVPFEFMYQNDNQEMVDFRGRPLNEPDLVLGFNTSRLEDALVCLEQVNESNIELSRQSDYPQSRPQSSGSSSRPQSSGSSRWSSSGSSSRPQSSGSSSRPLLSRSSTESSGSSSRPQSSGSSSRPQLSRSSSKPQSSGSSSQDNKFGVYDDASNKDDQSEEGDDSKQN